jgi:GTP-binding protein
MRREGFEIQVSKPRVLLKEIDGEKYEPIELAMVEVDDAFVGVVIEKMGIRKGEMITMTPGTDGYTRLEFKVPARGLIGFRNEFLTDTKGTGILNHSFYDFELYKGPIPTRAKGVLISLEQGMTVAYALGGLQDRGVLFTDPGVAVYEGMIVGEHNRDNDLVVNVCKAKKLTNMRASGSDDAIKIATPRKYTLEQALDYIADDELVEITPTNIRIRKKFLKESDRRKNSK